ncbi:ankyrin repeat domain-containing protein [Gammaproteobacteria bacterium]|nr:ankyrin repeat domain-containing protein [Gammaproteobacteria bacterium]
MTKGSKQYKKLLNQLEKASRSLDVDLKESVSEAFISSQSPELLKKIYVNGDKNIGVFNAILGTADTNINLDVLKLLLDNGAVIDYKSGLRSEFKSNSSSGILHELVNRTVSRMHDQKGDMRSNLLEALKLVIKQEEIGVNQESSNPLGQTVLQIAAHAGDAEVVKCLLTRDDLNLEIQDANGNTALHYTAMLQDSDESQLDTRKVLIENKLVITNLLLDKSINAEIVNNKRESAEDLANSSDMNDVRSCIGKYNLGEDRADATSYNKPR